MTPFQEYLIHIETPKWTFVKRDEHGQAEFFSPIPSPFDYGHVVGKTGGDGDPLDAIFLGSRAKDTRRCLGNAVGVVRFLDCDQSDDKWILTNGIITYEQQRAVQLFFIAYAQVKQAWAWARLKGCRCQLQSIEWFQSQERS